MALHNKINKQELKKQIVKSDVKRVTLSFYKYFSISDPDTYRDFLYKNWSDLGVLGRTYISSEGINAQISIPELKFKLFESWMGEQQSLKDIFLNIAVEQNDASFFMLKIKVRKKIVADGIDDPHFDASKSGDHLHAKAFNELTADDDTIVIDMRNHYESEVGHFKNAITPDVETFRESLPIVEEMLKDKKEKNIVMYCTGGIRCEKASAYLKHKGFENVFQLKGGIINYTKEVAKEQIENKFIGKNFVFDDRMGERISGEVISKCHQCGEPSDDHTNCANEACHILFIQCKNCSTQLDGCCSQKCQDFNRLKEEERIEKKKYMEFNGTKFGKGRYKANNANQPKITI